MSKYIGNPITKRLENKISFQTMQVENAQKGEFGRRKPTTVRSEDIQHSHWSSSYNTGLSLVESFRVLKYFHVVARPAILCHIHRIVKLVTSKGELASKHPYAIRN